MGRALKRPSCARLHAARNASGEAHVLGSAKKAAAPTGTGEEGFALIAVLVAVFLLMLALSIAAPRVARSLRRERELETERRAQQYVRAIRLYYKRFGNYPASMEQLEKSNNIRFLRQRWVDPMTGQDDWRLIHVGEQKTTTKGFFGKPLAGIASGGLGSAAGMASAGGTGAAAGATGLGSGFGATAGGLGQTAAAAGGAGSSTAGSGFSLGGPTPGTSGSAGSSPGIGSPLGSTGATGSGFGSGSGSSTGSGGPFVGVGVPKDGESIMTMNEKTAYNEWEFWYDPRIEQLLQRANLLGGGPPTAGGGLGSAAGSQSNLGGFGSAPGASGTSPTGPSGAPSGTSPSPPASSQPQQ